MSIKGKFANGMVAASLVLALNGCVSSVDSNPSISSESVQKEPFNALDYVQVYQKSFRVTDPSTGYSGEYPINPETFTCFPRNTQSFHLECVANGDDAYIYAQVVCSSLNENNPDETQNFLVAIVSFSANDVEHTLSGITLQSQPDQD